MSSAAAWAVNGPTFRRSWLASPGDEDDDLLREEAAVLVVDDNADTRLALSTLLGIRGYRTLEARNGRDALECLRAADSQVAVILLDLMMPEMDGHAFLQAKASDPEIADIPVVVYSALSAGALPGATVCIRKGTDSPDDLLAALERAHRGR
jgi:CheY-like chemotaxis protein